MAVLETIRTKLGVLITVLIAVALLSFIVDFNSLSSAINSTSDKYAVGKVGGKKVPYKDFQEQVEYQTSIVEMMTGSSISSDEQQRQIRDMAWQHFVDENLFLRQAKAAGIFVGKDEMVALTSGDMISPVLRYDPILGDRQGNFDKDNLNKFLTNMASDQSGRIRQYWDYVQNNVLTQQYYAKYGSLFTASAMPNALTLQNAVEDNNVSASIRLVTVPYSYERDTTITVSPSDIRKYYRAHRNFFRQEANRDIKYAMFEVNPSEGDIAATRASMDAAYDEFKTAENMKAFILHNSEMPYSTRWLSKGDLRSLSSGLDDFVFSSKTGASPVLQEGDAFYSVRTMESRMIPDSVYVRHILIQNNDALADSLLNVVTKDRSKFMSMAAQFSADKNPETIPGDIGWMTQDVMVPGMESVLSAAPHKPFILDTRYGRHIVEVTKTTKPVSKKQVAILKKSAIPSKATMNEAYSKATALASAAAGKLDNLVKAAGEQGVYLHEENVTEATASYGGSSRSKEVTRWVFEAKKGSVSNVITVNQNYLFVVGVSDIHKEGYATVEEASSRIESILYARARADKALANVRDKVKDCATLDDAAAVLGQSVINKEHVTFSSQTSRDNEPALLGAVAGAKEGVMTGPVKGMMGIYLVEVTGRTSGAYYTEDDARREQTSMNQYLAQQILPVMLESSDSRDNRERFY